jgi:hypothetical protein
MQLCCAVRRATSGLLRSIAAAKLRSLRGAQKRDYRLALDTYLLRNRGPTVTRMQAMLRGLRDHVRHVRRQSANDLSTVAKLQARPALLL